MASRKTQIAAKVEPKRCTACNGSGWYDSTDSRGRPIPCGACDGKGYDEARDIMDWRS